MEHPISWRGANVTIKILLKKLFGILQFKQKNKINKKTKLNSIPRPRKIKFNPRTSQTPIGL